MTIPRNDNRMFFVLIRTLLFQESLAQVRAVDGGMAGDTVGVLGGEIAVPGGRCGMAAEAQVRGALRGQHVPVIGAVDFVTGGAALDPGGLMFVKERAALVGVAADALLLLEPGQPSPGSGP